MYFLLWFSGVFVHVLFDVFMGCPMLFNLCSTVKLFFF